MTSACQIQGSRGTLVISVFFRSGMLEDFYDPIGKLNTVINLFLE